MSCSPSARSEPWSSVRSTWRQRSSSPASSSLVFPHSAERRLANGGITPATARAPKYSPLDRINRANVGRLQVAWRWSSPDNAIAAANALARPGAYQDTPLMANGVLYTDHLARHHSPRSIRRPARRSGSTIRRPGRPAGRRISATRTAAWPTGPTAATSGSSAGRTTPTSFRSTPRPESPIRRSA